MVAYSFNSQQYTPQYGGGGKFLPPAKKYKGIIKSTYTENVEKEGQVIGGYLAFDIEVIEGPLQGKQQTDRLNLHHKKSDVVEIANKQLSAYCAVTGKFAFQDTDELIGIPFLFDVEFQKGHEPTEQKPEGGYTQISGIYDINGNEPAKAGRGPQAGAVTQSFQPPAQQGGGPAPAQQGGGAWAADPPAAQGGPAPGAWPAGGQAAPAAPGGPAAGNWGAPAGGAAAPASPGWGAPR